MRMILLSWLALVGCTPSDEEAAPCPAHWGYNGDTSSCTPPPGYVDDLQARIGSGFWGIVKASSGDCSPQLTTTPLGIGAPPSDCMGWRVADQVIEAYDVADAVMDPAHYPSYTIRPGAAPRAMTTTSAEGLYELGVAPGQYAIAARDPIDNSWQVNQLAVDAAEVTWWHILFKHSAD
jgi:hypothetical protein